MRHSIEDEDDDEDELMAPLLLALRF